MVQVYDRVRGILDAARGHVARTVNTSQVATNWLIGREVLPNMLMPLTTEFGMRLCFSFLLIAALSFLGLGIQPPLADWGSMVRDNASAIGLGGIAPLIPAAAISLFVVGVNLMVDWSIALQSQQRD